MPALWSAPWWRLKWLHVPLFIHRHNKANNTFCHAAVRCSSPANLRISSSCPALSNLHQMRNSCHAQDFILSVKDKCALWKTQIILQQRQRGLPLHHFLTVWAYIQKVPQISPSFETNKVASKWHFRMDWGCKCHQFTGLNSKDKSPTWHFVSQFSLLHVNEVRSWWLAESDISAAACAWGKLSDHSAYLSPVFLFNIFTTWVVLSIRSTVTVQVRNPLVLSLWICILHLFSGGHEHRHFLNYVAGPCQGREESCNGKDEVQSKQIFCKMGQCINITWTLTNLHYCWMIVLWKSSPRAPSLPNTVNTFSLPNGDFDS